MPRKAAPQPQDGKTATKRSGRPSKYSDALADDICERIATTPRGLDWICKQESAFPDPQTVHRWLNDEAHERFRLNYVRARERQADLLGDECLEIADDTRHDSKIVGSEDNQTEVANTEWISRSKLRVETRMRLAGKLHPKKWGDKVTTELTGPEGKDLTFTDNEAAAKLAAILEAVKARQSNS